MEIPGATNLAAGELQDERKLIVFEKKVIHMWISYPQGVENPPAFTGGLEGV
jgi:hypothetical protein